MPCYGGEYVCLKPRETATVNEEMAYRNGRWAGACWRLEQRAQCRVCSRSGGNTGNGGMPALLVGCSVAVGAHVVIQVSRQSQTSTASTHCRPLRVKPTGTLRRRGRVAVPRVRPLDRTIRRVTDKSCYVDKVSEMRGGACIRGTVPHAIPLIERGGAFAPCSFVFFILRRMLPLRARRAMPAKMRE